MICTRVWFTDLDWTVIAHGDYASDKRFVRVTEGDHTAVGAMLVANYESFVELKRTLKIVPVTTRAYSSFCHVRLGEFEDTLTDNGARLFVDGAEDMGWTEESRGILSQDDRREELISFLQQEGFSCKIESEFVLDYILNRYDRDKVLWMVDALRKRAPSWDFFPGTQRGICGVYRGLSKGAAIERWLAKHLEVTQTMSSGDGASDFSMFRTTDVSVGPRGSGAAISYRKDIHENIHEFTKLVLATALLWTSYREDAPDPLGIRARQPRRRANIAISS